MTEQESSGGSAPVADHSAPAHTAGTTAAFQASDATAAGAFGSTRGSGLARGKRNAQKSAQPDAQPAVEYKPTSIELITPQREYSNPFASETPAIVPAPAPVPAKPVEVSPVAEFSAPAPVAAQPAPTPVAPVETPRSEQLFEDPPEIAPAAKPVINILPPEETKRTSVSWDSSSAPARENRPVFRPEPRAGAPRPDERPQSERPASDRPPGDRPPRQDRPRRDDRPRDDRPREDRPQGERTERSQFDRPREGRRDGPRENRGDFRRETPAPVAAPKSGGFFGWLKGLFGAKPEATPAPTERPEGQYREGGRGPRRDGRGRGRGGEGRPYQGQGQGQPQGRDGFHQDGSEGGREGGPRRRRRGRGRGRGGYNGGGHEPEGQQGGGAI